MRIGRWNLAVGLLAVVPACTGEDAGTDVAADDADARDTDGGSDAEADDATDTDGDTDAASETDARESDAPPDTDVAADSDTDVPPPPWQGGFVAISAAVEATFPPVNTGDRASVQPPQLVSLLVGDLDEDGVPEAVSSVLTRERDVVPPVRVWRLAAGGVVEVPELFDAVTGQQPVGGVLGLVDLDGDGHLDIVTGLARNPVRWGDGHGGFVAAPDGPELLSCGVAVSVTPWDVDADGWTDLIALCGLEPWVLRRLGPRRFAVDDARLEQRPDLPVHGVSLLSFPSGRSQVHLIVGDAFGTPTHPGWLAAPLDGTGRLTTASFTPDPVWWTSDPSWYASNILGIAAMGAFVEDLDQDGWDDLVLTPGARFSVVFRGTASGFVDHTFAADLAFPHYRGSTVIPLPWGTLPIDVDQDGLLDIPMVFGDDATSYGIAEGQLHYNQLWRQVGPWQFQEVADALNFTQPGGWRALTATDWDRDGDADLALGGNATPPRLLRNDIVGGADGATHHGVSLRLIGTTSSRQGLGARVEVDAAGLPTQHRLVASPGNPDGWVTPEVFVGLGSATRAARVRVTWPSGTVQEVFDLAADTQHELVEPDVIRVVDDDRRLPADGVSSLWIEVRPRLPDGTVDTTATVSVRLDGPGTVVGSQAWRSGAWTLRVRAPEAPGETRVIVKVNGTDLDVRPVLFWGD